jgi:hypothetical protein
MDPITISVLFAIGFAIGFAVGYGVRERKSRMRHRRYAERNEVGGAFAAVGQVPKMELTKTNNGQWKPGQTGNPAAAEPHLLGVRGK